MNDLDVQVTKSVKADFSAELINRFFDPKSYYLHSFLSVIRHKENLLPDPLHAVTIGLLVDEIINSPDKTAKLAELDRFDQFSFYRQQLFEGINYLRNSRLSTQQMMEIVGSLGKSLADTLIDLTSQPDSRDYLQNMLGLSNNQSDCLPAPELTVCETETAAAPVQTPLLQKPIPFLEKEPWAFFQEDIHQKIILLLENLATFSQQPNDWQVFKKIKNDFRDLRDWAMIQGDEGIEAISHKILLLFEVVYARAIEQRYLILPILKDACETLEAINQAGRGSEHLDIVRVMAHQIDQQRELFPTQFKSPKSVEIVIPEVPAVPEANHDAIAQIELQPPQRATEPEKSVLEKPAPAPTPYEEELESFIQNNLGIKKEDLTPEPVVEETVEPQESFDSIRESELLTELVNEHADHLDELELESTEQNAGQPEAPHGQEPTEIFLPGADDEELLQILSDLKSENNGNNHNDQLTKLPQNQPVTEDLDPCNFDQYIDQLKNEPADGIKPLETKESQNKKPKPVPTKEPVKVVETPTAGNGYDFITEADIYFSFARKALQHLMKNSLDSQALEDMELACYSLKILGEKLGYTLVGEMMSYAEQAVQKAMSQQSGLQTDKLNILFSVINELERAGKEQNLNEASRQKWLLHHTQLMGEWVESNSNGKKNAQPQTTSVTSAKENQTDDPLDFLLFDDTSKFFKQLLNE